MPCHRTTVTHAEAGSQLPDADFWEITDRVVGADGALITSYEELIHAKAAHLALLARLAVTIALGFLLERYPDIAVDATAPIEFHNPWVLISVKRLPVLVA